MGHPLSLVSHIEVKHAARCAVCRPSTRSMRSCTYPGSHICRRRFIFGDFLPAEDGTDIGIRLPRTDGYSALLLGSLLHALAYRDTTQRRIAIAYALQSSPGGPSSASLTGQLRTGWSGAGLSSRGSPGGTSSGASGGPRLDAVPGGFPGGLVVVDLEKCYQLRNLSSPRQ